VVFSELTPELVTEKYVNHFAQILEVIFKKWCRAGLEKSQCMEMAELMVGLKPDFSIIILPVAV